MLNQERTNSLMKGCQKEFIPHFFFSVISISELHNLQDQIKTLLGRNVG